MSRRRCAFFKVKSAIEFVMRLMLADCNRLVASGYKPLQNLTFVPLSALFSVDASGFATASRRERLRRISTKPDGR
jgi:hypothetical protein